MTEDKNKRRVEEESITHFPIPNLHLFIVTPNGVPVAELRLDRVEPGDARLDMARIDVDRLTAGMARMTRTQLTEMDNQLAGVQARLREFIARPNHENGNGNGGQLAEKPSTPPEEPTAHDNCPHITLGGFAPCEITTPAPPREPAVCHCETPDNNQGNCRVCGGVIFSMRPAQVAVAPAPEAPQAVVATPPAPPAPQPAAFPPAQPARPRRPRAPRRTAAERAAAVTLAGAASGQAVSAAAHRIFEQIQAGREQEAESDMTAARAQGAPAPLASPPAGTAIASAPAAAPPATVPAAVPPAPTSPPVAAPLSTASPERRAVIAATAPPTASRASAQTSPPTAPAAQPSTVPTAPATSVAPAHATPATAPTSPPATIEGKILAAVASAPKSFGQLSMETGGTSREIFTLVKQLMDAGKIRKVDQSYCLPG